MKKSKKILFVSSIIAPVLIATALIFGTNYKVKMSGGGWEKTTKSMYEHGQRFDHLKRFYRKEINYPLILVITGGWAGIIVWYLKTKEKDIEQ